MIEEKRIIHVLIFFCVLFSLIIIYLSYFELFGKTKFANNTADQRLRVEEKNIHRGKILDSKNIVLAQSQADKNNNQVRDYPFGALYSHVIGYNSMTYGKTLIESVYNEELMGLAHFSAINDLKNKLKNEEKTGNDVHLTLDHQLQKLADKLLKNDKGAIVAMVPRTGEILAMVSKPDFNPNEKALSENWQKMQESEELPFFSRALLGLYPPGSTFKVLTAASAFENHLEDTQIIDTGSVVIGGSKIVNSGKRAYGNLDIRKALSVSSNVFFSQLGVKLGSKNILDITKKAGFNKKIPFELGVNNSTLSYADMSEVDLAAVAYGQGKLRVTPIHMAMITSAIANNGMMMKPYIVSKITTSEGALSSETTPSILYNVMSSDAAQKTTDIMVSAVSSGTGSKAKIENIKVAGKTGTAQNEVQNKEHSWFICFAPANNPQIAVAVLREYSGDNGGSTCAPIARELIKAFLQKSLIPS